MPRCWLLGRLGIWALFLGKVYICPVNREIHIVYMYLFSTNKSEREQHEAIGVICACLCCFLSVLTCMDVICFLYIKCVCVLEI